MSRGTAGANPFVGPRPIDAGQPLYGRDTEVHELFHHLQARRIVTLHSPSGAGKSSLVQAGLAPRLRRGNYDVWRTIRVNLDPGALRSGHAEVNRYVLSAMVSLEEELPERHRRPLEALLRLDLSEYLEGRPRRRSSLGQRVVLIFDQFEELLTVDPRDVAAKQVFFSSLGRALEDERFWALFVVREDYLGALAPYRAHLPTLLTNTYRLDLLSLANAREAAVQLAADGGRSFPGAEQMIDDLSLVQVQRPDGGFEGERGSFIEPVYLQVVGHRLWAVMPVEALSIDAEDVARYGEVTGSLAGFYADAVARVAGGSRAVERAIRDWVAHRLLNGGIRSQVRHEAERSAGLANTLIEGLLDGYVVRSERRAGATWYELSHDRLVAPIIRDNELWERTHLHSMQVMAKRWEEACRAPALLLDADALPDAERWARDADELLTRSERDFLDESRRQRRSEAEARALREQGAVLRNVLSAIPHRVFWKDRSSVYQGANALFAALAGLESPDEIVDKTDFDLPWTREESEAYRADDAAVMGSGASKRNIEETQLTADGELVHLVTDKVPLRASSGEINGVLGISLDISERRRLEAELAGQRRLLAELAGRLSAMARLIAGGSHGEAVLAALSDAIAQASALLHNEPER